jgi:peptide/nickel transport system permease protein
MLPEKIMEIEATPGAHAVGMPITIPSTTRQRLTFLKNLMANRKALAGALIVVFFIMIALLAPVIAPGDPTAFVGRPHQEPSAEHWGDILRIK